MESGGSVVIHHSKWSPNIDMILSPVGLDLTGDYNFSLNRLFMYVCVMMMILSRRWLFRVLILDPEDSSVSVKRDHTVSLIHGLLF